MIYSKTSEYAIRSLTYFADRPEKELATVKTVSRETGVPQAYVAKIFQCLAQGKILDSQRGPSGGYSLLVAPTKLTILRVVEAMDDLSKSSFANCVMGLDKCNDKNACPLHDVWKKAKDQMMEKLASSTIADVAKLGRKFRAGKHQRLVLSDNMRSLFSI